MQVSNLAFSTWILSGEIGKIEVRKEAHLSVLHYTEMQGLQDNLVLRHIPFTM